MARHRSSAGIEIKRCYAIGVFLAFTDKDWRVRISQQMRQAIRHAGYAVKNLFINPTTFAIGLALFEILGIVSHHLIKQPALTIRIVVGRDDTTAY